MYFIVGLTTTSCSSDIEWCDVEAKQVELYKQATEKVPTGKLQL